MAQPKSEVIVLKKFFGLKSGQSLSGFQAELKGLSNDEKLELAQMAAREMGLTQGEVTFSLT